MTTTLDRPMAPRRNSEGTALLDRARAQPITSFAEAAEWFEQIYRDADGDASRVPWAKQRANPALTAWMNAIAPSLVRPGGRVAVVGCGFGHDAAELVCRGYDVLAFDVSTTAVEWARRIHPGCADRFIVADVTDMPSRLRHRFDLVVESNTIQSVPPALRAPMISAMAELLGPHGVLLAIARGRSPEAPLDAVDGPPWPMTAPELTALMSDAGLAPTRAVDDFDDDNTPPVRRLRGSFKRA